ncbi:rho guanine nucleotide exchange factor 6-like isoform X2 [Xyrauchen texanus]|uniref:rho guanine nucleotide exchange factor 6-like isoform X2 n=1 Tax=Xyrauchen texanus TaxID=154827 RepID=UPI002241DB6E|nr:rho guanine nucleotide exchange factor 6-like isoform X2 [Xyrauchen texanus]
MLHAVTILRQGGEGGSLRRCTNVMCNRLWSLAESRLQITTQNGTHEVPHCCPSVSHLKKEDPDPVSATELTDSSISKAVLWGWTKDELHHRLYTQPIREWEGRAPHTYGDIIHSSSVYLHSEYTKAMSEQYLVLFSFHLLILSLDSPNHDFMYEGILPLSTIEVRLISQQDPNSPHMFEIRGPMVDSKIFICASAAETKTWMENIEDRRYKSLRQQLSPYHSTLSYLVPCDESWKREELKRYLLRSPIFQWEGKPIQHMGYPKYLSMVHISNIYSQARVLQGHQERLLLLFPFDLLILSVDCQRVRVKYEGRLPLKSIKALERSALPGRLEFELTGEMMEPLLVSCIYPEDYQSWIFQLQQPDKVADSLPHHTPPPLIPKKRRS